MSYTDMLEGTGHVQYMFQHDAKGTMELSATEYAMFLLE